jgi:putative transposase
MDRAIAKAGKKPRVVNTDALGSYLDVNYGKGAEHRVGGPFDVENNTNLIERFHGTFKARTKVMRALKNLNTAHRFLDAWLVHYNYLRPHESLDGQTPAQAAAITYKNWDELSRNHKMGKTAETQPKVTVREVPDSFEMVQPKPTKLGIRRTNPKQSRGVDLGADIVRDRHGRHLRLN